MDRSATAGGSRIGQKGLPLTTHFHGSNLAQGFVDAENGQRFWSYQGLDVDASQVSHIAQIPWVGEA